MDLDKNYLYRCFRWLTNELIKEKLENKLPPELNRILNKFYDSISKKVEDMTTTDEKSMLDLGFIPYEISRGGIIWLIPLWMYPLIPENTQVYTTTGSMFEFHEKTAPKDTMFNCLKYGILDSSKVHKESVISDM